MNHGYLSIGIINIVHDILIYTLKMLYNNNNSNNDLKI